MNERSFIIWFFSMVNSKDNSLLDKRQLILNSAEHMIAKNGFQGLSMNKLAQEAGVAAGIPLFPDNAWLGWLIWYSKVLKNTCL